MKTFGKILFGILLVVVVLGYYGLKQMAENEDLRKAQGVSWKQLELFGFKKPHIKTEDLPSQFLASKVITPIQMNFFPFGKISVKELTVS